MFKTTGQAAEFIAALDGLVKGPEAEVALMVPFTALAAVKDHAKPWFSYGAQNLFWAKEGAYTGEISAPMLIDLGCTYVLAGHSERRQILGETDEMIQRKVLSALENGLRPILCVGEILSERQANRAEAVVDAQLSADLAGISVTSELVIAYEPVWAIGTGVNATPADAQEMCGYIRQWLAAKYGAQLADSVRVLYGGSVKPDNIDALMAQPDIDGALVGGASLDPAGFARIIQYQAG